MTPLPQTTHADTALALAQGSNMAQKSWILVGAQQAGASEKKMAEIAQLPRRTVRRILSNFARTGVPSIPMQTSRKGTTAWACVSLSDRPLFADNVVSC